ncbi:MAG TPA: methyltransferase domain-containing protein [Methanobacteriaceae archaeon]|nr:methyltransferase domain-containing protein [Methanobacteriaceae archaeon]
MDNVKNHFQEEAEIFDGLIKTLIPHYQDMIRALVCTLPFHSQEEITILDIGSGTGNVSLALKERFPNAHITCLDLAEKMIQQTRAKMNDYSDVNYVVGDLRDLNTENEYDAIVSSLAIHHLSRAEYQSCYGNIYTALKSGGVFYNADNLQSSSKYLNQVYIERWKDFMLQHHDSEEIDNVWFPKHYEEDNPQPLSDHLDWLKEAGFQDVDVVWKYYYFGVYGGKK